MPQTIQALGALALISVLTFNVLQSRNRSQHDRVRTVVTDAAEAAVLDVLETLESAPFDSAPATASDPAPLTALTAFGPGTPVLPGVRLDSLRAAGVLADVDDYQGLRGVVVEHWLNEPVVGVPQPLVFRLDFDVAYVASGAGGWSTTTTATRQKRALVKATWRDPEVRVEMARIYSDLR